MRGRENITEKQLKLVWFILNILVTAATNIYKDSFISYKMIYCFVLFCYCGCHKRKQLQIGSQLNDNLSKYQRTTVGGQMTTVATTTSTSTTTTIIVIVIQTCSKCNCMRDPHKLACWGINCQRSCWSPSSDVIRGPEPLVPRSEDNEVPPKSNWFFLISLRNLLHILCQLSCKRTTNKSHCVHM